MLDEIPDVMLFEIFNQLSHCEEDELTELYKEFARRFEVQVDGAKIAAIIKKHKLIKQRDKINQEILLYEEKINER